MSENSEFTKELKICLIGDGGVGKTTYINRVLDGPFEKKYVATVGAVIHNATCWVSPQHKIRFNVWDTAGQEKKAGLKDLYYIDADGAMFFYDVTSRVSANNLPIWIDSFKRAAGADKPIVVVANKVDITDRKVNKKAILGLIKSFDYDYCEISAKTTFNYQNPFVLLGRAITKNPNLTFTFNLDLRPTEVDYDKKEVDTSINEDYDYARQADIEE